MMNFERGRQPSVVSLQFSVVTSGPTIVGRREILQVSICTLMFDLPIYPSMPEPLTAFRRSSSLNGGKRELKTDD
jgi:hypothetical protein